MYNIINASSNATRTLHPSPVTQQELNAPSWSRRTYQEASENKNGSQNILINLVTRNFLGNILKFCSCIVNTSILFIVPQEFAEACSFDDLVKFNSSLNERVISFNLWSNLKYWASSMHRFLTESRKRNSSNRGQRKLKQLSGDSLKIKTLKFSAKPIILHSSKITLLFSSYIVLPANWTTNKLHTDISDGNEADSNESTALTQRKYLFPELLKENLKVYSPLEEDLVRWIRRRICAVGI